MVFTNLPEDIRIYFIKFFDIYMLQNYALTYKYGLESIGKYLLYRRLMNEKNNIKSTIENSLIRLREKYCSGSRMSGEKVYKFDSPPIIKIIKVIKTDREISKDAKKCYFIIINQPALCGDKYYMYPDWSIFKTIDFDKEDYIPHC